jgi:hypothetical protein
MSEFTDEIDSSVVICPYCKDEYEPEGEDFNEESRIEECGNCGSKYYLNQQVTYDNCTQLDCEINGDSHKWESSELSNGNHDFCSVCDKCRPIE